MIRLAVGLLLSVGAGAAGADGGLAFLRLGAGARADALGGATTALTDPQAAGLNPAALPAAAAAALSHGEWIGDVRHEQAAVVWRQGAAGAVALDLRVAHAGGLERRLGPSERPLGEFGVYEWTAGAAWARPLHGRWRLGAGARLVRQSIDADAAAGVALDLGLRYAGGPWSAGAAVRNVGSMNDLDRRATELPVQARAGVAVHRGALLASVDAAWTRGAAAGLHAGAEWQPRSRLVLRAGYQTADRRDLSAGLGVVVSGAWRLDYAVVPFAAGLGRAHRLGLVWTRPSP